MLLIISLQFVLIYLLILPKFYKSIIIEKFFILNLINYQIYIIIGYYFWLNYTTIFYFDGLLGLDRIIILNEIQLLISGILLLNITPLYNSYNLNKNTRIEGEIYQILLGGIIGMILIINSKDWIITIQSQQQINQAIYFLLSLNKNSEKTLSGGFKYLLLSALASTFILLGIAYIYYITGSTNYENIYIINSYLKHGGILGANKLIQPFLLILIGLFFKLGCAPFHQWLPDLYDCLPFSLVIWIAILPKITLLAFQLNIIPLLNYLKFNYIQNILLIISIISLFIGNIGMGSLKRIKRFIAYSSISHLGFLLLALSHLDLNNYYIYYWVYMLTTINIFLIFIIILRGPIKIYKIYSTQDSISNKSIENTKMQSEKYYNYINYKDLIFLNQLKGLFLINKPLAISLGINFLSLAGIPPLAGFFAKAWIFLSLIKFSDWSTAQYTIITSTIGTAYYIKLYKIFNLDSSSLESTTTNSIQDITHNNKNRMNSDLESISFYSLIPNTFVAYLISLITLLLIFYMFKPLFIQNNLAYSLF